MDEIECPYCEKWFDYDGEYSYADGAKIEMECPYCDKKFLAEISWHATFHERQVPCMNGEPHLWEKIHGYPTDVYENRRRCTYCEMERNSNEIEEPKL